jgi:DNA-directed RNA polymerase, mitochondrial
MTTSNMLEIKVINNSYDNSISVLRLTDEVSKLLDRKNPIISLPINLPMIVKPKPYSENDLGGYLLNDIEYDENLIRGKLGYNIPSTIQDENIIYFVVNKMMETPFKVNKELLNYLIEYNHIHKLLINPDYKHEFSDIKRNKSQEIEYQKFISKKLLEEYIIKIAQTYSNVPEIFFPIKLDNRGRLYPIPAYFHYQASELAKALILFARPDKLKRSDKDAIEYLKAYGGSCYGNGLNRKSYEKRLEWVSQNWEDIINYDKSNLVNQADNKILFLSFCLEMKRFDNFLNNEYTHEFNTCLPIQLDGTCNGFEHLTLLSNESKLFEVLNLFESSKNEDPKDFYQHIINQINIHLEKKINSTNSNDEKESYERLLKLGLSRSNIKYVIMTKPYNAKDKTLVKYILDTLILNHTENKIITDNDGNEKTINIKWYKINKDSPDQNLVNRSDVELLVKSINDIIYINYPNIKLLSIYLNEIAKIFNKLNLPIIWRLPSGLMISQKYMQKHTTRIKPFSYLNTSLSLTITDKINIDKQKQISALMPNLVHSLDAASLSLLYNSFYNSIEGDHINFYSVHDCFGVTAKYIDTLITLLRSVYIDIYSNISYIKKFDNDVINYIITFYGEEQCKYDEKTRILFIGRKKIVIHPS